MGAPPPQIQPLYDGLDRMIVHVPAAAPTRYWTGLAGVAVPIAVIATSALAIAAGPPWLGAVVVLAGLAGGGVVMARAAERDAGADHRITFSPGKLQIDDEVHLLADVLDVRWDCEAPRTELVLVTRTGERRLACARRGLRDVRGVTRRQREWIEGLIRRHMDGGEGRVPAELRALRE